MLPQSRRQVVSLRTLSWVTGALVLLGSGYLFAQAGGGGSFGGGHSSSGGGGGDGLGIIFVYLIRFAIAKPILGVPLLLAAIGVVVYGSRKGASRHRSRTIRRGSPLLRASRERDISATIQAVDADFDRAVFLRRVEVGFLAAQESWCKQELEPLRAFVSDGIFERFSLQIDEQKDDGWRQGMENTILGQMEIIHFHSGLHFDTITVRIPFDSRIHRVSLATGEKLSGSGLPRTKFEECWSLIRRRGVTSVTGKGLIEGHCPNCTTPIELNASALCHSCKSLLRSGEYDWVLSEITQASEWQGEDTGSVVGLAAMQELDPDLNLQHLEDRASVMFWRKVAADRQGKIDPLSRVARRDFIDAHCRDLERGGQGRRSYVGDCAVGSVKTIGLLPGEQWVRAVIEIRWDGRFVRIVDGQKSVDPERRLRSSFYVLGRKVGVRSEIGHAVSSSHCPTCGAPDEGGTGHACDYCGAVLNDGEGEWVLTSICSAMSDSGRALRSEIHSLAAKDGWVAQKHDPPSRAMLHWALETALADGEIEPRETRAISLLASKCGVSADRLQELVGSVHSGDVVAPEPSDEVEAKNWLDSMIVLALADGTVSAAEERLLLQAGAKAGYVKYDVSRLIKDKRRSLYRESRAELRAQRRSRSEASRA